MEIILFWEKFWKGYVIVSDFFFYILFIEKKIDYMCNLIFEMFLWGVFIKNYRIIFGGYNCLYYISLIERLREFSVFDIVFFMN